MESAVSAGPYAGAAEMTEPLPLQPAAVSIANPISPECQKAVPRLIICNKIKTNKHSNCCKCGVTYIAGIECLKEVQVHWPDTPSERVMLGRSFDISCASDAEDVVLGEPHCSRFQRTLDLMNPQNPV